MIDPPAPTEEWLPLPAKWGGLFTSSILSGRQAETWSLVLQARHLPCRSEPRGFGWQLLVPAGHFEAALRELRQYEDENRDWPPPPPVPRPTADNALDTVSVLLLLAAFHFLTTIPLDLAGHRPVAWIPLGSAHAGKILAGDWWRPITALTLHADVPHLLGNLAIGGVFMVRLAREVGSGLAWTLVIGAGVLGNVVNAFLQQPAHRAIGASTAVFGAVGILAALSLLRYRRHLHRRWPLPVAAALALLALLGSEGVRTDVGAHLFGFAAGLALGLAAELLMVRYGRPGRLLNAVLVLASAAAVSAAWWGALSFGRP